MRDTSNPVFRSISRSETYISANQATYGGMISKTLFLLFVAVAAGFLSIMYIPIETLYSMLFVAMIVGFISVIVATRSVRLAMPFSILYSLAEGLLLGVITAIFESMIPGIAFTAIMGTLVIFFVMLFLYASRTIRVTDRFRRIMFSVMLGLLVFFILFGILSLFGGTIMTNIMMNPTIALGVGAIMIVVGALMLTLDFERAESIVESGADKAYEWVVSVGLMVTVIWIYIEILRFVAILTLSRNR
ncbi:MAG: Bax inhibitor-1/YccA family protein [Acholeplasmataceae bacterium]|nr:Bax inhibitor-1/YccA family protein [Acholeplasmataceae bacterium]